MERLLPSFTSLQERVFTEVGGSIYLGREKVTDNMRGRLRDEARTFQKTELWEILNASATNEAYNVALIQSKNFEEVQFSKALHHWGHFMRNVITILAK